MPKCFRLGSGSLITIITRSQSSRFGGLCLKVINFYHSLVIPTTNRLTCMVGCPHPLEQTTHHLIVNHSVQPIFYYCLDYLLISH
jgi:hypothetical protein